MKTKTEKIRSSINVRKNRKLRAEIIIYNLEKQGDQLDIEDNKKLKILKGLVTTENTFITRERTLFETIKKNEALILLYQKINQNLISLETVTEKGIYTEVSNYMENCMNDLALKHNL